MTDATNTRRTEGMGTAALFVHLRLETWECAPWLAHDDVAQATQMALAARARLHRCRVLAVGCGDDHLHAVLSFPESLPLNTLIRQMQQVSGQAAAQALAVLGETGVTPDRVWSRRYQMDTLSESDVPSLIDYICRHPDGHTRGQAQPEQARAAEDSPPGQPRPAWPAVVRERSSRDGPRSC